ncbi:MAG: CBS domain-containing protein [Ruminococcaceae bacterium]|nr:CBS domain-containing protein [Oscillospiraceae bacterium]
MKVRDIMSNPAVSITGEDTVCEAARIMQAHNIGVVPVTDDKNKVEGIITDRDIVLRTTSTGKDACVVKVKDVMTTNVELVSPDDDISNITQKMKDNKIRRFPVTQEGELVGMLSLGDIASNAENKMEIADAISEISR